MGYRDLLQLSHNKCTKNTTHQHTRTETTEQQKTIFLKQAEEITAKNERYLHPTPFNLCRLEFSFQKEACEFSGQMHQVYTFLKN